MIEPACVESTADAMLTAWTSQQWIPRSLYPAVDSLRHVYAIHAACVAHPLASSTLGGLAGYKQGGGGDAAPFVYAPLFTDGLVASGGEISHARTNLIAVEAELGFVLGTPLNPLPDERMRTVEEVMAAVDEVVVCLEYCGRRYADGSASPMQAWADLCSGAGVVCGTRCAVSAISRSQLASLTATLLVDGVEVAKGGAEECPLGSPVASLTGCANHLNGRGLGLQTGQLIITGNMARCKTNLAPGLEVEARLGWASDEVGLGSVRARVVA